MKVCPVNNLIVKAYSKDLQQAKKILKLQLFDFAEAFSSISLGTTVMHKKTGNNGCANYFGGGMLTGCIMGNVKIVNSIVLLSLVSLTSGPRLSP